MKLRFIIYILISYIILMGITLSSIINKMSFQSYLKIMLVVFVCILIVFFCINNIIVVFFERENSIFQLDIADSEDDIKDILKQVSEDYTNDEAFDTDNLSYDVVDESE